MQLMTLRAPVRPDATDIMIAAPTATRRAPIRPFAEVAAGLAGPDFAFVLLFVSPGLRPRHHRRQRPRAPSPNTDRPRLHHGRRDRAPRLRDRHAGRRWASAPRTSRSGRDRFIPALETFSVDHGAGIAAELMSPDGMGEAALWPNSLAMLMVDGLSRQEDAIVASLAPALGAIPLIGGSAGDGLDFGRTFVLHERAVPSRTPPSPR